MPYYTYLIAELLNKPFARYAEIMPYYTFEKLIDAIYCLLGMLK